MTGANLNREIVETFVYVARNAHKTILVACIMRSSSCRIFLERVRNIYSHIYLYLFLGESHSSFRVEKVGVY